MAFGNGIGFAEGPGEVRQCISQERYAAFLLDAAPAAPIADMIPDAIQLGSTSSDLSVTLAGCSMDLRELHQAWRAPLESVYPTQSSSPHPEMETFTHLADSETAKRRAGAASRSAKPKVIIPVFPGTNCEYDTARAFRGAGADPETFVFRNLTGHAVEESLQGLAERIRQSQILMIPGGFSAGDEPDGSGKFIATVLRNPLVRDAVMDLLENRDGLILGICNGFQALIKTGLLPYGEIRDPQVESPTLSFNDIGRHVSCYVTTRVASTLSPWLAACQPGDLHQIPVSHGEGKFFASREEIMELAAAGQIATQYCDLVGDPSMAVAFNPNGSLYAIEGITSPDGRVLGKMGHTERRGTNVARNIPGSKHQPLFKAGVRYFVG